MTNGTKDPPATLDEPDTDCEVIAKLRAEIERLHSEMARLRTLPREGDAKEIERLTAALKRIDAINDNPARYNGDTNDVIMRALEQTGDGK